jgi:hypothetical protein
MTTFIKPYIVPEKIQDHKNLFNFKIFGKLKFYFVISYLKTNIFFSFYCKSMNFYEKVFLFYSQSLGLENRDNIRKGAAPSVALRGRRKTQFYHIKLKFNMAKAYLHEFIRCHPEIVFYKNLHVVWKMHKLDMHINNLLSQPFNIDFYYDKKKDGSKNIEPQVTHHFYLKFPHNGCRPKKVRRLKKRRRR